VATTYKDAGVDQTKKDAAIDEILKRMKRTHGKAVIDLPWGFAGLFQLMKTGRYKDPVLVSCTDGVGTKLKLARQLGKHDTVGIDLVAMSVNDLVVTGGKPLFFLDYVAMGKVEERVLLDVVKGIVDGCERSDCALIGGETAEMPGMYADGDYDLAGFAVGVVERKDILDGSTVKKGDDVIALASSGLHSNGYSLARKVVEGRDLNEPFGKGTLGATLLEPTRLYPRSIAKLLKAHKPKTVIRALANITGGGMVENIPRVIPKGLAVEIAAGSWEIPPIFELLRKSGDIPRDEMFRVFNMGVGMVAVVPPGSASAVLRTLRKAGETAWVVGTVVKGDGEVKILEG
jgi:phosphoribosylformylglycinamidine cyclo-ligase